jgi:predicted nucleic acid-binding Zn ribbon protein
MSGPQVIEVVVIDSDINDTDEAKGEPDVTVNGKILRMVQAVDGNWYGYFADRDMAQIADSTSTAVGDGLDYGTFCGAGSTTLSGASTVTFTDTVGIAVSSAAGIAGTNPPTTTIPNCAGAFTTDNSLNVVREAKQINTNSPTGTKDGQIGLTTAAGAWPFIQLYQLNPTGNVVVQYNKGGGAQTTTLTFDSVDQFAGAELDRASYTQGAEVHATITDLWLNIDPTDEDSWTFGTTGIGSSAAATTNYQVFDENGNQDADLTTVDDISATLGDLMCEDNCVLITNTDVQNKGAVITLQDNDDSVLINVDGDADLIADPANPLDWATGAGNILGNVPITMTEQGPNSGVFGSYDESDASNIIITTTAARGTSANLDYNETPVTILVGNSFGSVDIQVGDDEWNSGEEVPVVLVDADANKNSRADEDLDLFNPDVDLIPALKTGDPFTLAENSDTDGEKLASDYGTAAPLTPAGYASVSTATTEVEKFSKRAIITSSVTATANALVIDLEATAADLQQSINDPTVDFSGFNFYNQDVRSISTSGPINVAILHTAGAINPATPGAYTPVVVATAANPQSLTNLAGAVENALNAIPAGNNLALWIDFPSTTVGTEEAIVADFFSFGFTDDGVEASERVANQIVRLELEETGDNTSTFEGTLEYVMVNQLNILDAATYAGLTTVADDPTFIVIEDLTDEDAPRVNYLDKGADGVDTQVSDQEEAPSHSGIVSFDNDSYKIADTVTITLEDADLNVDVDLIDIFTVVDGTLFTDDARDTVGEAGLPTFSFGPLGRLLDVTFDDQPWQVSETCTPDAGADTGLGGSGFSLIETETSSGIFLGDFQVPTNWCRPGESLPETTTGLDIEVNYVDFRDASGEIIEVGDSAGIRANTGSVSLDRTVYPVPFGVPTDFGDVSGDTSPDNRSIFAIHATGINGDLTDNGSFLPNGDLTIHVRVNDPDFDISASGEDSINRNTADLAIGPVEISVQRGSDTVILGYAGGPSAIDGTINVGTTLMGDGIIQTGEIVIPPGGLAPTAGTFAPGPVTIVQGTTGVGATGTFNDINANQMSSTEFTINTNNNGFVSQDVTLTQVAM